METEKNMVLANIKARRSTRVFVDAPVESDILEDIIEAGRYAPSGNNTQQTHFIVITNKDKLAELRGVITAALANIPERDDMPPFFRGIIQRAKVEEVDVSYGAPVVIVTASKKGNGNAPFDIACAMQNMMLTATAAGVGSCWINQTLHLREAPPVRAFFEGLGLAEDEELYGSLVIGNSDDIETTPLPRTGCEVTYIR